MFKKNDDDINLNKKGNKYTIYNLKLPVLSISFIIFLFICVYGVTFQQYRQTHEKTKIINTYYVESYNTQ